MSTVGCSPTIQVLPGDVVSRIAAGEVIERPAAVVKELVENSLDAGSRSISVDVKDGGLSLIRVIDDGEGMGRADLPLAFERHATSKLRSDRDLTSVLTMGFRGEALPSIASVSKVRVATATRQDAVGAQMSMIGGAAGAIVDVPPIQGTTIEVAELFFNQPARKKFLKSPATEFSHISHAVQQAALAWASVHFRLTHNGQDVFNYPAVASYRDRILQVYRAGFLDRVLDIKGRIPGCVLVGVIVEPVQAKTSKQPQDLFVNRRPVKSPAVFHAVMEGFGAALARGHHPTFVLYLDIDPDRVDVNVHPAKREIRFAESETVHQLVRHAVRHAVSGPERVMGLEQPMEEPRALPGAPSGSLLDGPSRGVAQPLPSALPGSVGGAHKTGPEEAQLTLAHETAASYENAAVPDILPMGQILRRYLVAQVGRELQVIDQHTAHERVLFQRLQRQWQRRELALQPLLIPEPVELTAAHYTLVERHRAELETMGLVVEPFGEATIAVRAVPIGLGKVDAAALVRDLLDDLGQWDRLPELEARVRPVLASLACHGAVRAGRPMGLPEIAQLLRDWVEEGLIMTCPHGRRTAFRLSTDELDTLFGRAGWS